MRRIWIAAAFSMLVGLVLVLPAGVGDWSRDPCVKGWDLFGTALAEAFAKTEKCNTFDVEIHRNESAQLETRQVQVKNDCDRPAFVTVQLEDRTSKDIWQVDPGKASTRTFDIPSKGRIRLDCEGRGAGCTWEVTK